MVFFNEQNKPEIGYTDLPSKKRSSKFQGPVRPGDSERYFRARGLTKTNKQIQKDYVRSSKFQGPVRPGDSEKYFRETGVVKSEKQVRKEYVQAIEEKEATSADKRKIKQLAKQKRESFFGNMAPSRKQVTSQLKGIGQELNRFSQTGDPRLEELRRREILRRAEMEGPRNFFEHQDPIEVYGSDELMFFDSQGKARNKRRTGSFFGI